MIIDFHTHTFPDAISERVLAKLSRVSRTAYFTDGSTAGLLASMKQAGISYSVNLPVMTDAGQVEKVNNQLTKEREALFDKGIITFGGMHPDYADYKAELTRLKEQGIKGIKLHPAYQKTDLGDIKMMRIIDCASGLGLIVLVHAGIDIGIYDRNYSPVSQILKVIDEIHPPKLVLAHMGGWGCWEDVERDLAGAPVWLDTAFSIGALTPSREAEGAPYRSYNLSDEDFVRLVRKHGSGRVLFATDSPWESQEDYIRRLQNMPLTESEQEQIFSENARQLLALTDN